jgi:uncharacterized protein YfaS (alpha-2-macroglobulin family)
MPTPSDLGGGLEAPQPITPTPLPPEALPIIRQRFPQTLYWNPEAITDETGRLRVPVPVGDTITTWRITALAVDRFGNLGSATAPLAVFQPLFLEPQLPATMPLGEELVAPVWIFNYSSEPMAVTLTAQASPGLQTQVADGMIQVPANDGTVAAVGLKAVASGPQTVLLLVQGNEVEDARQVDVLINGEESETSNQ